MSAAASRRQAEHRCKQCGRVFASADLLEAHMRMEHGSGSHPPAGVG